MRLSTKRWASGDDLRKVVLAALATALDDRKEEAKEKPGLTGVRAVATGAVIYTAGRAAFSGGRLIKERFGSDGRPVDSEDEEFEDEEYDDEPRAEDEDEREDEDYEGPEAEEDEDDYEEEPEEEKPRAARPSRRPPRHAKRIPEDSPIAQLPSRPSRSRSPVGRA